MNAKWGALQFSLSPGLPGRGNSGEWNLIHTDAEEGECWVRKRGPGDQDGAAETEPQCPLAAGRRDQADQWPCWQMKTAESWKQLVPCCL